MAEREPPIPGHAELVFCEQSIEPTDLWVTRPIAGRNIVSLQTCFPEPTFEKRLIVRGQLVS